MEYNSYLIETNKQGQCWLIHLKVNPNIQMQSKDKGVTRFINTANMVSSDSVSFLFHALICATAQIALIIPGSKSW